MPSPLLAFFVSMNIILLVLAVFMAVRRYWLLATGTLAVTIGNAIDLASRMGYLGFIVGLVASLIGTIVFVVAVFTSLRRIRHARLAEDGKHSA